MNYLWEVALNTRNVGLGKNRIRFKHSSFGSAYMELSLECLNQENISDIQEIEVNTYYRFYKIFKDMFKPELKEFFKLRENLTNLMLHMLADNDVRKGMTKEAYNKKMLLANIKEGYFGEKVRIACFLFNKEQQEKLLYCWLKSYRVGDSLLIFIDMIHKLIDNSIVYHSNESPNEILIYTGEQKTGELKQKLWLLSEIFLGLRYQVEVFYEYHFGIMGIEDTMLIDEIAMY
jgi:hypothetical protein